MMVRLTGIFSCAATPSRQRTAFGSSSAQLDSSAPSVPSCGCEARSMMQPRSASSDLKISSMMRSSS